MPKPAKQESGSANLLLAVCMLTAFAGLTALASAYISTVVLDLLQSRDALVMIVTDAGIKSDSVSVEQGLSAATLALKAVREQADRQDEVTSPAWLLACWLCLSHGAWRVCQRPRLLPFLRGLSHT